MDRHGGPQLEEDWQERDGTARTSTQDIQQTTLPLQLTTRSLQFRANMLRKLLRRREHESQPLRALRTHVQ